jgi:multidrug resistance efflux pump
MEHATSHEKGGVAKESRIKNFFRNPLFIGTLAVVIIIVAVVGFSYLKASGSSIYTDKAEVSAPATNLAATMSGTLEEVFVNPGDTVAANTVVARVGNELIKTTSAGIITSADTSIGKIFNPGETIVSMINPDTLRVVGHIDENKGFSDIQIGEHAIFTIDAFGSKKFDGIVDEISPTSRAGDVVFNISDKRATKQFDVKIRFNTAEYPEIKDGMSAKLWIYKN